MSNRLNNSKAIAIITMTINNKDPLELWMGVVVGVAAFGVGGVDFIVGGAVLGSWAGLRCLGAE